MPSSSDEEVEKLVSQTVSVVKKVEPFRIKERSSFSETMTVDTQERFQQFQKSYLPQQRTIQQLHLMTPVTMAQTLSHLEVKKRSIDSMAASTQQLKMLSKPILQQRRFSETIAIDHQRPTPIQLTFELPERLQKLQKAEFHALQQASLKGMKMEVEIKEEQKQKSELSYTQKKHATAIETQRHEVMLQLSGDAPKFITNLLPSIKVMDGEEIKFHCVVKGNPMPTITWFKNGKVVVDNPDFRTSYDKTSGSNILSIIEVFPQDTGEYKCIAVNMYGKAITSCNLTVEMHEYIADSEEASASAAESLPDTKQPVSEDEAEFLERTQAFISNMAKLRQELQEEFVKEEEVMMSEEFNEEYVQMADVKWQIPQRAITMEEEIMPEVVAEAATAPMEEISQEEHVTMVSVEMAQKAIQQKYVDVQDAAVQEEIIQEITSEVQEIPQEQEIVVEMATVARAGMAEHLVGEQVAAMKEEITEEVTEVHEEVSQEEHVTMISVEMAQKAMQQKYVDVQDAVIEEGIVQEMVAEVQQEVPQEEEIVVEMATVARAGLAEHLVGEQVAAMKEEITEEVTDVKEEVSQEEHVTMVSVEMAQKAIQQKYVDVQDTVVEEGVVQEMVAEVQQEVPQEEEIVVEMATVARAGMAEHLVGEQVAAMKEENIEEVTEVHEEVSQEEHVQMVSVEMAQKAMQQKYVGQQEAVLQQEIAEEIFEDAIVEVGKEEEISAVTYMAEVEATPEKMVQVSAEQVTEEITEELTERVPTPEGLTEGEVIVEMGLSEKVQALEMRAETQEEKLSEGSIEENLEELTLEIADEEAIARSLLSPAGLETHEQFVGFTEERHSEEEEEDIFFEAPEPAPDSREVVVELATVEKQSMASMQTSAQDLVQEIGMLEEANLEFDEEETLGQEVLVDLSKATKAARPPSLANIMERMVSPHMTEEFQAEQVTEEQFDETKVIVDLGLAAKEEAKPSRVGASEDVVEVQQTKEDVIEYTEEQPEQEEVHVTLEAASGTERPVTRVDVANEDVRPEQVAEEYVNSIKEIYMIPSVVRPEYEPTVVERYRFETHVRPQDTNGVESTQDQAVVEEEEIASTKKASPVALRKAQSDKTVVRAAQEVTEECEVVTEVITEEIEVIKKPEISEELIQPIEEVRAELSPVSLMAPVFEIPLSDITVSDGEKAFLECKVTGVPKPAVQWFVDGQQIKASMDFKTTYEDGYCILDIHDVLPEDEGEYTVKAINDAGTCVTTAYLTVLPPSRPESEPESPMPIEESIVPLEEPKAEAGSPQETVLQESFRKMEVELSMKAKKEVSMIEG